MSARCGAISPKFLRAFVGTSAMAWPPKVSGVVARNVDEARKERRSMWTSPAVLLVANLLHPIDVLAVELFLDCDMAHGRGRRSAVPVLFARRKPDDVARTDFLDRATVALHPTATGRDNQRLA